jgi:hypothetical protein
MTYNVVDFGGRRRVQALWTSDGRSGVTIWCGKAKRHCWPLGSRLPRRPVCWVLLQTLPAPLATPHQLQQSNAASKSRTSCRQALPLQGYLNRPRARMRHRLRINHWRQAFPGSHRFRRTAISEAAPPRVLTLKRCTLRVLLRTHRRQHSGPSRSVWRSPSRQT